MGSLRSLGALVLGAGVLAACTTVLTPAPGALAAPGTKPTELSVLDPVGLPLGDPPTAAYISRVRGGPIYRAGADPLDTGPDMGSQDLLVRARGGYLVSMSAQLVRFVGDDGSHHDVFSVRKRTSYIRDVVTSHDGRYAAISLDPRAAGGPVERIVIRRIAAPRTIAQRAFPDLVKVASLTAWRALLTPARSSHVRGHQRVLTRWWTLRDDRLHGIARTSGYLSKATDFGGFPTGDMSAGQVAVVRGDHERVTGLSDHQGEAWNTRAHEWVVSWSPDDRYVLTLGWTPQRPRTGHAWDTASVRRARDGALISSFTGFQNVSSGSGLTWQDDTTVLLDVWDTCDHGSCANVHNIRCAIQGPCEQLAIPVLPASFTHVEQSRPRSS